LAFSRVKFCAGIVCAAFYLTSSPAISDLVEPVLPAQSLHGVLGQPDVLNLSSPALPQPRLKDQPRFSPFGLGCDVHFTATALPAAMVRLNLIAPCHINQPVIIRHNGLAFTATTTNIGHYETDLPALQSEAEFQLLLAGSKPHTVTINMPDARNFRRVALVWSGVSKVEIHAFELQSAATKIKHIWRDNPQSPNRALQGRGGFLTRLGGGMPDASHAEIYSFPTGQLIKPTTVRLHVSIGVDANNCNQNIPVTALQPDKNGKMEPTSLSLLIPACSKTGEQFLLKNLLSDLRINKPYD